MAQLSVLSSLVQKYTYKQGEFIVQLLAKVTWNWNAIWQMIPKGMDRVVNDDSLAEVSAKPGEILHIQIGVRVHTVLPVESVVEVLPLRVDQLQALISIPLLHTRETSNWLSISFRSIDWPSQNLVSQENWIHFIKNKMNSTSKLFLYLPLQLWREQLHKVGILPSRIPSQMVWWQRRCSSWGVLAVPWWLWLLGSRCLSGRQWNCGILSGSSAWLNFWSH